MGKAGSFGGDALEDVVDERVHDSHGFAGDTSVRVNLLQHLVDVDSIAFLSLSPSFLLSISGSLTLGSRGYFFLIDTDGCVNEEKITSGHRSTQPHFHVRNQFRV